MSNSSTGCSVPAPELSQYRYKFRYMESPLCTLLIDSGYSFTHVVPYCKGKKLRDAVCRSVQPCFIFWCKFFCHLDLDEQLVWKEGHAVCEPPLCEQRGCLLYIIYFKGALTLVMLNCLVCSFLRVGGIFILCIYYEQ